jgi:hypothetical protein
MQMVLYRCVVPVLPGGMMLGKGGEEVQSRTLDSYNLTGVSLIKIDAQGAEPLVMYGGRVSWGLGFRVQGSSMQLKKSDP